MEYNFREIEKKWQKRWVGKQNLPSNGRRNEKEILGAEHVPLPLRCGIARRSSARRYRFGIDARYKRLQGFNVRIPWDMTLTVFQQSNMPYKRDTPCNYDRQQYQPIP